MSEQNGASSEGLLGRDDILNAQDIQYEIVDVPEWTKPGATMPAKVRVKSLAAIERDDFERGLVIQSADGKKSRSDFSNLRAKLCARAIVDQHGKRVFKDEDILALGAKSAAALDRVYEVAARLAKISQEDVNDLKGNSKSDPSGDSSSGSP